VNKVRDRMDVVVVVEIT